MRFISHILLPLASSHSRRLSAMALPFSLSPASSTLSSTCFVYIVPCLSDNYGYVVVDKSSKKAALVDTPDAAPLLEAVNGMMATGLVSSLDAIWNTHKHGDHVGGNLEIKEAFPDISIIGTRYESVPGLTHPVGEGDSFTLGGSTITVLFTPCHTAGHICFIVGSETETPLLFSGDTLFVGGCGRFFEGQPEQMVANMQRLAKLPASTLVFCAHEYTLGNLKFLNSIDKIGAEGMLQNVQLLRDRNEVTVPSTIGKELSYNLFMKIDEKRVQSLVGCEGDPVGTMRKLREMKNEFRG